MIKLNKNSAIVYTTIGIMSMILVYVMFIQFRIVNENDTEEIQFMRETELREMLATYKTNHEEAEKEIEETQSKIDEYKQNEKDEETTVALLETELNDAKMKLGLTDVYGEGITITMEDTEDYNVSYTSLLTLVNELAYAGAEAISINDERIISRSDIVNPGSFMQVNGTRVASPYTIKAIGDTKKLQSAISIKNGFIDTNNSLYKIYVETGTVVIGKYGKEIKMDSVK